ncbi:nicotinamide N-methyltransferase [Microcaecilia unicolor]|uniref:Nicotinamide N-methyltransferase-like n=1 Tax=Microcaecilia unicolor TaxID=1415580 RepID=A0A6P7ZSC0_9AMPH|nr:nicotinamide N-methyltransferase-like [Microcaecilia unicolor]XP_030077236.1 nicotinamide N-methyltransferase-like [Microcaecilia unicolor]XP_030077237.1 nicotinamide N-methyltransferase-like [Microcaecilia unicolor]
MDFTDKDYYLKEFDPIDYLNTYYNNTSGVFVDNYLSFTLKKLFETFKPGGVTGNTLIDVGAGPAIYQIMSACEVFKEIIVTDFTDKNRQEYERWLKKAPGIFDWSPIGNLVCELEGNRQSWVQKEEKIRRTVSRVLKCDILKANPVDPVTLPQADCVVTSLCLEAACKDLEALRCALKNIASLLKTGGNLVMCGVLNCSFYLVGQKKFFSLAFDDVFLRKVLSEINFVIKELEVLPVAETKKETCDHTAFFFLLARKQGDAKSE